MNAITLYCGDSLSSIRWLVAVLPRGLAERHIADTLGGAPPPKSPPKSKAWSAFGARLSVPSGRIGPWRGLPARARRAAALRAHHPVVALTCPSRPNPPPHCTRRSFVPSPPPPPAAPAPGAFPPGAFPPAGVPRRPARPPSRAGVGFAGRTRPKPLAGWPFARRASARRARQAGPAGADAPAGQESSAPKALHAFDFGGDLGGGAPQVPFDFGGDLGGGAPQAPLTSGGTWGAEPPKRL